MPAQPRDICMQQLSNFIQQTISTQNILLSSRKSRKNSLFKPELFLGDYHEKLCLDKTEFKPNGLMKWNEGTQVLLLRSQSQNVIFISAVWKVHWNIVTKQMETWWLEFLLWLLLKPSLIYRHFHRNNKVKGWRLSLCHMIETTNVELVLHDSGKLLKIKHVRNVRRCSEWKVQLSKMANITPFALRIKKLRQ